MSDAVTEKFWQRIREDERVQRAEQVIRTELQDGAIEWIFSTEGREAYATLSQMRLRVALELRKAIKEENARLLAQYPTGTWAGD